MQSGRRRGKRKDQRSRYQTSGEIDVKAAHHPCFSGDSIIHLACTAGVATFQFSSYQRLLRSNENALPHTLSPRACDVRGGTTRCLFLHDAEFASLSDTSVEWYPSHSSTHSSHPPDGTLIRRTGGVGDDTLCATPSDTRLQSCPASHLLDLSQQSIIKKPTLVIPARNRSLQPHSAVLSGVLTFVHPTTAAACASPFRVPPLPCRAAP